MTTNNQNEIIHLIDIESLESRRKHLDDVIDKRRIPPVIIKSILYSFPVITFTLAVVYYDKNYGIIVGIIVGSIFIIFTFIYFILNELFNFNTISIDYTDDKLPNLNEMTIMQKISISNIKYVFDNKNGEFDNEYNNNRELLRKNIQNRKNNLEKTTKYKLKVEISIYHGNYNRSIKHICKFIHLFGLTDKNYSSNSYDDFHAGTHIDMNLEKNIKNTIVLECLRYEQNQFHLINKLKDMYTDKLYYTDLYYTDELYYKGKKDIFLKLIDDLQNNSKEYNKYLLKQTHQDQEFMESLKMTQNIIDYDVNKLHDNYDDEFTLIINKQIFKEKNKVLYDNCSSNNFGIIF